MAPPTAWVSRRRFLTWTAAGAASMASGCRGIVVSNLEELAQEHPHLATRAAAGRSTPSDRPTEPPPSARALGFDTDIRLTSSNDFYRVQYGGVPDSLDLTAWRLRVDGMVSRPLDLSLADLAAFRRHTLLRTLACISNPPGGDLIGNAVWEGVRLADVLAAAAPLPGATELRLASADGYSTGIDLELAMDPASLLATGMNGAPLPHAHGRPVRCLFPGRYGQKQPKWLTHIELRDSRYVGHWEAQGWSDPAPIQVTSRIDVPASGASVPQPVPVAGIAFSGLAGVARVELLLDDQAAGAASLRRAPAPYSETVWTEWDARLTLAPGNHTLMARAVDGAGIAQHRRRPGLLEGTKPDGSLEMHRVRFFLPAAGNA